MTHDLNNKPDSCFDLGITAAHKDAPLSECVETALSDYFEQLDGHPAANLYDMLLAEVEAPLFRSTLAHTNGNQCRAAEILGINRGTLRKKLKLYGL
ncbi:MAG: DNA-binding transcriptional regulator Fis [Methylophaga sp.]|nr:MAG: DNA-binding transcriptional regulator Fis [Methylophaga sp.]